MRQRLAIQVEGYTAVIEMSEEELVCIYVVEGGEPSVDEGPHVVVVRRLKVVGPEARDILLGDREPSCVGCVLKRHGLLVCR